MTVAVNRPARTRSRSLHRGQGGSELPGHQNRGGHVCGRSGRRWSTTSIQFSEVLSPRQKPPLRGHVPRELRQREGAGGGVNDSVFRAQLLFHLLVFLNFVFFTPDSKNPVCACPALAYRGDGRSLASSWGWLGGWPCPFLSPPPAARSHCPAPPGSFVCRAR